MRLGLHPNNVQPQSSSEPLGPRGSLFFLSLAGAERAHVRLRAAECACAISWAMSEHERVLARRRAHAQSLSSHGPGAPALQEERTPRRGPSLGVKSGTRSLMCS